MSDIIYRVRHKETFFSGKIDAEDKHILVQFNWRTDKERYAVTDSFNKKIYMHRVIMSDHGYDIKNKEIDHINGDRLDNRKTNLRVCSLPENRRNAKKRKGSSSIYKGVSYDKARDKYRCEINFDGKRMFSKRFDTELEAAQKYNEVATFYHKQYAKLNKLP